MDGGNLLLIYPAIDILGGKCVRLEKGNYSKVTVYSDNPVDFVSGFAQTGAQYIHVVDLDGARTGEPVNDPLIREIVKKSGIPVQTGGGIRSLERIESLIKSGVSRVILGTSAVRNPEIVKEAVRQFGNSIAVGIDARDGFVATDGWEKKSKKTAVGFAREMEDMGVSVIIYTDISTDGMLMGPNTEAMAEMALATGCSVIASGGVSCVEDLIELSKTGVTGAIVGKAIYEGRIDLAEAIRKTGE